MREILFRGKRIDNGEWVFGFYCYNPLTKRAEIFSFDEIRSYVYQVIPETVGQYTGLTDKNGTKIFEGDIIMYGLMPCVIKWEQANARYMLYDKGIFLRNGFNTDTMQTKEVVGNIHDNPELLEV